MKCSKPYSFIQVNKLAIASYPKNKCVYANFHINNIKIFLIENSKMKLCNYGSMELSINSFSEHFQIKRLQTVFFQIVLLIFMFDIYYDAV